MRLNVLMGGASLTDNGMALQMYAHVHDWEKARHAERSFFLNYAVSELTCSTEHSTTRIKVKQVGLPSTDLQEL